MPALKSTKQCREEIRDLSDRVQAIVDVATTANRELSADEKGEMDKIQGRGKPAEANYLRGQVEDLRDDLDRAERIEARQLELAQNRAGSGQPTGAGNIHPGQGTPPADDAEAPRASRIRIPAKARYVHGSLKAFTGGQYAHQEAYISGMFVLATLGKSESAQAWCKEHGVDTRFRGALTEGANELGGFLVPDEMEARIIVLRETYGVFRRESKVEPMMSDTKLVPRRTGGVTAYFVGEAVAPTESDPTWDNVKLVAKKLATLSRYSSEVDEDAIISLADMFADEIAYAFALKEDECGFIGDGTSTYGGIVGVVNAVNAGSIVTADTGDVSFETLDMNDFEACIGKLPEYAETNAKWFISKAGHAASMMRLLDAAGGNTWETLANGRRVRMFLGYEVQISQVLNKTLGSDVSQPKVILGDLKMATTLGSRRGMSVAISDQRYFELDQLAVKGTQRVDINVHDRGTASVGGAVVVLKTAAS